MIPFRWVCHTQGGKQARGLSRLTLKMLGIQDLGGFSRTSDRAAQDYVFWLAGTAMRTGIVEGSADLGTCRTIIDIC